jgi:acyl dehydratase
MSAPEDIYFDDIVVGELFSFGPYRVREQELLEFNRKWDPLPIHLDDAAARAKGHRGITASGQYTLCVKQVFLNQARWSNAVIGALGFDEVRFPHPVYIGDELSASVVCTDKRASRSKPDRGIVTLTMRLYNQSDVTVLSYIDTVMFARRSENNEGEAQK